ncbi:MAG: Hpt domain-containing protein [Lachnospiraceae bacterium]|nr:Hpt domain-containing protein [Lachnospiraceae bacterium]
MGIDLNWLAEAGLDTRTGISYTGGADKYLSAVQRFFKNHEKNRRQVDESLAAKDLESYMITVHALKSNARMIGALKLSEHFESLEMAARDNDLDFVAGVNPSVMEEYAQLIETLKPVGELGDVRAADEISAEEAKDVAAKLLEALDDFDDEKARELAVKLSGYPFRITQAGRLKEAIGSIEDFMYDEAAEIVKEILPAIE